MAPSRRFAVVLALILASGATELRGQQPGEERPKPLKPTKTTQEDKDTSEAEKLYGLALLRQKQDRLVEAQEGLVVPVDLVDREGAQRDGRRYHPH